MAARKILIHITVLLKASSASTCCTCCISKDSPREKSINKMIKGKWLRKICSLTEFHHFFQKRPTCNERVSYPSTGVFIATVVCDKLVDESAFSGIWIDTCQVGVWVHAPGQKFLFWGKECHVAEVPVVFCKRGRDF